ncbi:hypothetical protein B0T10DRAFT_579288 [Thelonectria olida]|uniref:Uncharacterized protein n=1 Tax=Thelonectria olida TaxID=1576542 RepID=A0A9P8W0P7_9HYPO|nr:hypothetical protein B0T10DRAFT_579288 [Thelonectria olida]
MATPSKNLPDSSPIAPVVSPPQTPSSGTRTPESGSSYYSLGGLSETNPVRCISASEVDRQAFAIPTIPASGRGYPHIYRNDPPLPVFPSHPMLEHPLMPPGQTYMPDMNPGSARILVDQHVPPRVDVVYHQNRYDGRFTHATYHPRRTMNATAADDDDGFQDNDASLSQSSYSKPEMPEPASPSMGWTPGMSYSDSLKFLDPEDPMDALIFKKVILEYVLGSRGNDFGGPNTSWSSRVEEEYLERAYVGEAHLGEGYGGEGGVGDDHMDLP